MNENLGGGAVETKLHPSAPLISMVFVKPIENKLKFQNLFGKIAVEEEDLEKVFMSSEEFCSSCATYLSW